MAARWQFLIYTLFVVAAMHCAAGCGGNNRGTVTPADDDATVTTDDDTTTADGASADGDAPAADGGETPAEKEVAGPPFDLTYVSDDFFAAVYMSPKELSKNPALFELIKTQAAGELLKDAPFDLTSVSSALILSAPRTEDSPQGEEITLGVVLKFENRIDAAGTVAMIQEKGEKKELGDKTYYTQGPGGLAAYISDDYLTYVLSREPLLKKMLQPGQAESPLLTRLREMPGNKHDLLVVADSAPVGGIAKRAGANAPSEVQPQLEVVQDIAAKIKFAVVAMDLSKDPIVKIQLDSPDPAAAEELSSLVRQSLELALGMAGLLGPQYLDSIGLTEKQSKEMLKLAKNGIQAIQTTQNEATLNITVKRFEGFETMGQTIEPLLVQLEQTMQKSLQRQATLAVGQAMLRYHEDKGHFPPAATYDKEGKPLLSWRVALLPYLRHEKLYEQFHLDEPWDSEHNIKLLPQMPLAYGGVERPDGPLGALPGGALPLPLAPQPPPPGDDEPQDDDDDEGFKIEQPGDGEGDEPPSPGPADESADDESSDEKPADGKPEEKPADGDKPAVAERTPAEAEPGGPAKDVSEGLTRIVVFVGKDSIFAWKEGLASKDIPDGPGATILFVQAPEAKAVPWTKPADLPTGKDPAETIGDTGGKNFMVVFADGHMEEWSVEDLPELKSAVMINDGGEKKEDLIIE